jgi:hypothetical protein
MEITLLEAGLSQKEILRNPFHDADVSEQGKFREYPYLDH